MIVVSDTSPLTALLAVGEAELLPKLFHEVVIPEAVRAELCRSHPKLPDWLRVATVQDATQMAKYSQLVDAGEAEAIELARELQADRLLIDERKGRKLAVQAGIPVIGLLGVVLLAKRKGLIASARRCSSGWTGKRACISRRTSERQRSKRWASESATGAETRQRVANVQSGGLSILRVSSLRVCLKTPERGCVVLDQPQQVPKFRCLAVFSPCCGWSSTQPRSIFRQALSGGICLRQIPPACGAE